jgi:RNA polymerase sigma factor (sigma-70 family)
MDETTCFEEQRPRLLRLAGRILRDSTEAEDVVQQAWLRLHTTETAIDNLPAWLTTVTTRICLDRLRAPRPILFETIEASASPASHAEDLELADTVGIALQIVLDRLTPNERVAFVLHDSFTIDFATIAAILGVSPASARKLASRARSKVAPPVSDGVRTDWEIVDAFLAAARQGDFENLLRLLAPDVVLSSDHDAVAAGTPPRMEGQSAVATMFNGAAKAAFPVFIEGRPGAAWFHRGSPKVAFDFTVIDGLVSRIDFRADKTCLERIVRRDADERRN